MDYIEFFVLVAITANGTDRVAVAPTLATCQVQHAEFVKQALPKKPGTACVKHRQYYIADFSFKELN